MGRGKQPPPAPLWSIRDVACYLQVTPRSVRRYLLEAGLPGWKVGGTWRFKADAVVAWVAKSPKLRAPDIGDTATGE